MYKVNIEKFISLVDSKMSYYANMLNYPEAKTDLIIYLLNIHKKIDFSKFNTEDQLKYFLYKCLDNERKQLFSKIKNYKEKEYINTDTVDLSINSIEYAKDFHSDMFFFDIIKTLSPKQQDVLYYKFFLQLSDMEISNILNISRQAIHKTKTLALTKLRMTL